LGWEEWGGVEREGRWWRMWGLRERRSRVHEGAHGSVQGWKIVHELLILLVEG